MPAGRNLIAYICLTDALDRNGEVMIFWGESARLCWGRVGVGRCCACACVCVLYLLTQGRHMHALNNDYHQIGTLIFRYLQCLFLCGRN